MTTGQGGLATLPRPGVALGLSIGLCLGFGLGLSLGLGVGMFEVQAVLRLGTAMLAVFLAAAVSSVVGFAFTALCSPLLRPLTEDPVQAVVITAVASLSIQGLMIWRLRRDLECRGVFPFLPGGLVTLPLGGICC